MNLSFKLSIVLSSPALTLSIMSYPACFIIYECNVYGCLSFCLWVLVHFRDSLVPFAQLFSDFQKTVTFLKRPDCAHFCYLYSLFFVSFFVCTLLLVLLLVLQWVSVSLFVLEWCSVIRQWLWQVSLRTLLLQLCSYFAIKFTLVDFAFLWSWILQNYDLHEKPVLMCSLTML